MARQCNLPYEASKYACAQIARPLPGASSTGFVNIVLNANGKSISVGNKSSPSQNNATYINSMTLSIGSSPQLDIEIVDYSGQDFNYFIQNLSNDSCDLNSNYGAMLLEFGWIITDCNGQVSKYGSAEETRRRAILSADTQAQPNGFLCFVISQFSSQNSNGIWKYKLSGAGPNETFSDVRQATPIGSDAQKVNLATSRKMLFDRSCKSRPLKTRVPMLRQTSTRNLAPAGFPASDGGENGPKSVWSPDRQDPISALRKWMNSMSTDRKLGTFFVTSSTLVDPNILVIESLQDECNLGTGANCATSRQVDKVYIVNGGDCSPVLSFDPEVKFVSAQSQGGGQAAMGVQRAVQPTRLCGKTKDRSNLLGLQTAIQVPTANYNFRTPDEAAAKEARNIQANAAATKLFEYSSTIEADLTIQGDPYYASIFNNIGSTIGIIYLNPFNVSQNATGCDWLATPSVNQTFSRTDYNVVGVSHNIDNSGKYTTTLKLKSGAAGAEEVY